MNDNVKGSLCKAYIFQDLDSKVDPKAIRPAQLYVRGRRPNGGAHFQNLVMATILKF